MVAMIPSELTQITLLLPLFLFFTVIYQPTCALSNNKELAKGFRATVDSSVKVFQPLLSDSVGNYSFGFIRVDQTQLAIGVVHVPSNEPVWVAGKSYLARWSERTSLVFNGSLVVFDKNGGVLWSSHTDGDRVRILGTSNLVIEKVDESNEKVESLWQSFDFPYNTLMEGQNFTSEMTLVSSNGLYSMKLGPDFIGFYAKFDPDSSPGQLYFRHNPLEAKASVMKGQGPIRVVLSEDGFLGMYQNGSTPVDVQPFSSFQQSGTGNRLVRLEPDGNLVGYYWTRSSWVVDFKQISDLCELPSSCGPYGLCQPGKGCSCLDNKTSYSAGAKCAIAEIKTSSRNDFCQQKQKVMRKTGVELPNKEILDYTITSSLTKCESACEQNCTCWGAVYSNTSGFCYMIDYPIQTIVEVLDESKMGYFKVRYGSKNDKKLVWLWVGLGLLCGLVLLLLGVGGVFLYKRENRGVKGYVEEDGGVNGGIGPYKNLGSSSSKSIELSESWRKQ